MKKQQAPKTDHIIDGNPHENSLTYNEIPEFKLSDEHEENREQLFWEALEISNMELVEELLPYMEMNQELFEELLRSYLATRMSEAAIDLMESSEFDIENLIAELFLAAVKYKEIQLLKPVEDIQQAFLKLEFNYENYENTYVYLVEEGILEFYLYAPIENYQFGQNKAFENFRKVFLNSDDLFHTGNYLATGSQIEEEVFPFFLNEGKDWVNGKNIEQFFDTVWYIDWEMMEAFFETHFKWMVKNESIKKELIKQNTLVEHDNGEYSYDLCNPPE